MTKLSLPTTVFVALATLVTSLPARQAIAAPRAYIAITPSSSGGINASSYNSNAFTVRNESTAGETIVQVRIDLRTGFMPDMVFDPAGTAGDTAAKCLVADTGAAIVGFVAPSNPCTTPFSVPHHNGYDVLTMSFNDFNANEEFKFSVDVDPTSIQGTSGQGSASPGSVSGLEMTGATLTVQFGNGTTLTGQIFRQAGSSGGGLNWIRANPPATPSIQALGISSPATVGSASQTIRVSGPAGAAVRLLRVEATLDLNGGNGFDLDPFEANSAVAVAEQSAVIGAAGTVDVPVTLTRSSNASDLNYIVAAIVSTDGSGRTGNRSNVVVLEYSPQCSVNADCNDGDSCTTDTCSAGVCQYSGSCTTGVQVDTASIRSACAGAAGDSITISSVPVGSQSNRILVVAAGAEEDDADCNLGAATATYGGIAMTRAVATASGNNGWRACNGIFYLLNPPSGTANVVVNFPTAVGNAIDNRHAGAFVIHGAAQNAPQATYGAGGATNPVNSQITTTIDGALVVDVFTQGEVGTSTTQQSGQTKRWEQSCTSSSSAGSTKSVPIAGTTTLGWSHSAPKRYAHALAAFAPPSQGGTTTTTISTTTTTTSSTSTTSSTTTTTTLPGGGGQIAVDAASIRTACEGSAGDTITVAGVPVGSQPNRVLIATVGAEEDNADCNLGLATATYGGLPMTRAVAAVSGFSSWRACSGIFYLLNPPVGSANVVINFPAAAGNAIDNRHAGAFVLYNAAQAPPQATFANGGGLVNPVTNSITTVTAGALVVDVMTQGEVGTFTPLQSGQVATWQRSCTSSSSATSTKLVAGASTSQMGWSHSAPRRYAHALAAFSPASAGGATGDVCFVAASDPTLVLAGAMTTSTTYTAGADADAALDSLAPRLLFANSSTNSTSLGNSDHATYVVTLPETATWYLWGRFYYPGTPGSNEANSFLATVDGQATSAGGKFGNNKGFFRAWHWDGNGNVEQGTLSGLPLGTLGAGAHSIRILKREVTPIPPRLDVVCLTRDGFTPPSDAAVRSLLGL